MPIEFKEGGSGYSLGVEEELSVVDATTGELVPKIEELAEFVSYELFQSVLEIKTPPCATAADAERHLRELRGRVGSWAAACGASLASAGTHPFSRFSEQAPLLLALSANSPFWQDFDTGFESCRVKIFETFPRAGLPPAFPDWESF